MRLRREDRIAIVGAALITAAAVIGWGRPTHHDAPAPAPTTTTGPAPVVIRPVTRVELPEVQARVLAEQATQRCTPPARAIAWAEIDAAGTLLGVHAQCATGGDRP